MFGGVARAEHRKPPQTRNRILELTFLFEDLPVYLLTLLAEVLDALHELVVVVLKSLRDENTNGGGSGSGIKNPHSGRRGVDVRIRIQEMIK